MNDGGPSVDADALSTWLFRTLKSANQTRHKVAEAGQRRRKGSSPTVLPKVLIQWQWISA